MEFKRRSTELMQARESSTVDDAIAVASIRERIRTFGVDGVRGL